MIRDKIVEDITSKLNELLANSPARDVEKNVRALLASGFARLDLVTREEFEVQQEVLVRTREKLEALAERVAELERRAGISEPTSTAANDETDTSPSA